MIKCNKKINGDNKNVAPMEHTSLLTSRWISVRIASRADVMGGLEATSLENTWECVLTMFPRLTSHHVSCSRGWMGCLVILLRLAQWLFWLLGRAGRPPFPRILGRSRSVPRQLSMFSCQKHMTSRSCSQVLRRRHQAWSLAPWHPTLNELLPTFTPWSASPCWRQ
jgi:hypothetical protein